MINEGLLKYDERAVFALREIFVQYGYRPFKMSKFEEYDLYSKNKEFLTNQGVITFNDTDGRLLALKPDVTLSIIKNAKLQPDKVEKYYYNENVYRISQTTFTYKEIMQTGLECIGNVRSEQKIEVLYLALKSLSQISKNFVLEISDVGLINALFEDYQVQGELVDKVKTAIAQKNVDLLTTLLTNDQLDAIKTLILPYKSAKESLSALLSVAKTEKSKALTTEFTNLVENLLATEFGDRIKVDFSVTEQDGYYSGIVFKGYVNGISSAVLIGGQYDKLVQSMGKKAGALGFAVYLTELERLSSIQTELDDGYINVALPKGRLGEKVYDMFEKAGFDCPAIKETGRKLIFENKQKKLRFFWVKPSDVTIYVERGSADIGVAGKDILLEYTPDVYELLDLNIGKCKMAVAAKKDFVDDDSKTLRVATKFSKIAKDYYASKCRDIDIIHLNGSIEIAPILGLSDVIVDIVETGKTLIENDLVPFQTVTPISARLISNKSSFGFKGERITQIKKALALQVVKND
ncbi:MAG: ATP phosphoribosyltransferase [Clostridia bacterium]|nr:ATP phosphoribosyltransferase [Clostridia bacterium]